MNANTNTAVLFDLDGMAAGKGPFSDDFRRGAKDLGAKWNGEHKAWAVEADKADDMRALLKSCYGVFLDELAGQTEVATRRTLLRVTDTLDGRKRGTERLVVAGVTVATIWRGKAGKHEFHDPAKVYLADGVTLVSGCFEMDDAGRMQAVGETVLSVELPVGAESTVEFEVLGEDEGSEERFSEAVEKKAAQVEKLDQQVYERVAEAVALEDFAVEANRFDRSIGSASRLAMRPYAYLLNREGDDDCPAALKAAVAAVRRRVAGGKAETLPAWSVSSHERVALRAALTEAA